MLIQMNRKLIFETPAPFISASSWVILDRTSGEILFAKNEFEERQVASLTKVMTCLVVLTLIDRFGIGEHREIVTILHCCAELNGTSASLVPGDHLTVWELLHGMMLPSGNDAAQSLAIHFGLLLLREEFLALCKAQKSTSLGVVDK
jgi:D-alanyl-D-alanine carboxypeptidase